MAIGHDARLLDAFGVFQECSFYLVFSLRAEALDQVAQEAYQGLSEFATDTVTILC